MVGIMSPDKEKEGTAWPKTKIKIKANSTLKARMNQTLGRANNTRPRSQTSLRNISMTLKLPPTAAVTCL